jgi:hypothetical protein
LQRRGGGAFAVVFRRARGTVAAMSLNRCEQRVFDYWERHRDERQFWMEKVRGTAKNAPDYHVAATQLEGEMWRYYVERSGVVPVFRDAARHEGLQRTSMKNLAELAIRLWAEPKPKKKPAAETI